MTEATTDAPNAAGEPEPPLDSSSQEFVERKRPAEETVARIKAREEALAEREAALAAREQRLTADAARLERELARLESELERHRRASAPSNDPDVESRVAELEQREQTLEERESELKELELRLAKKVEELTTPNGPPEAGEDAWWDRVMGDQQTP
jgi:chromosome segregation ATPase